MKSKIKYIVLLSFLLIPYAAIHAQYADRFNNSFKVQYGLLQYNNDAKEWVNADHNYFLNVGISYRMRLGKVSGLSLAGRHYESRLNSTTKQNTDAVQLMWEIHPNRVGRNWHVNRIMPYLGIGVGYENHILNYDSGFGNSNMHNFYIPIEVGIDYSLNSRFSLGVFAEYKLSGDFNLNDLIKSPTNNTDRVNSAGIALTYFFGRNKKRINMPEVYTTPSSFSYTKQKVIQGENLGKSRFNDSMEIVNRNIAYHHILDSVNILNKYIDSVRIVNATGPKPNYTNITIINGDGIRKATVQNNDSVVVKEMKIAAPKKTDTNAVFVKPNRQDSIQMIKVNALIRAVENNQSQMDSMANEINSIKRQLQNQDNKMVAAAKRDTLFVRDTLFLKPQQINTNDNSEINQLKANYNRITADIDKNYQQGNYNQEEINKLKADAGLINNRILALPNEKGNQISNNEIAGLIAAMALLQKKSKPAAQPQIINQYVVPTSNLNKDSVQQDSLLMKIDSSAQTDTLTRAINSDSTLTKVSTNLKLEELGKNQADLREKIAQLEQQNQQLIEIIKKQTEKVQVNSEVVEKSIEELPKAVAPTPSLTVHFDINAFELNDANKADLADYVNSLPTDGRPIIMLSGYADKSGNAAYNLKLSQKRIHSVWKELTLLGIDQDEVTTRNFGSSKAQENAAENERKVVIKVLHMRK